MKFFKKTLILLCSVLALVAAVALSACGGGGKSKLCFETFGGTEIAPIEAEAGEDITSRLPATPARGGYTFGGWYLDEGCTGEAQTLPTAMPEGEVTYYAKWVPATGATAYLTLDTGSGGVQGSQVLDAPVGVNLIAFLGQANMSSPAAIEGLTFAAWYNGDAPLAETDVMPAGRLTLTAKYYAKYTVEVYRQGADGQYAPDTSAEVSGSAFFGEPFSCEIAVTVPEHYTLQAAPDGKFSTDSLGVDETFKAYLSLESYYVLFSPNTPQGATVSGTTPMQTVVYGSQAVLPACGYTLGGRSRYRFAGWATGADGATVYEAGATVDITASATFYAVWEKGYTDVFGGQDVLYPDHAQAEVIRLVREGVEEKIGTYAKATGLFSFKEGETTVLEGRLLASADEFFYFRDTVEGTYKDMDGTTATLAMNDGAVIYTDAENTPHAGKYSIDPDTGYFLFESDDADYDGFLYNLFESTGSREVVFRRQNTDELGYYYDAEAGAVLSLDGLGGLQYYYSTENCEYQDFFGEPIYVAYGYYEWRPADELFLAYTRDISVTLKQFTFKTETKSGVTYTEEFPDLSPSVTIKGAADLDDELRGSYIAKREDSENTLTLDGYGNAQFGETGGTYQKFTWLYSYEEEDGEVIDDYYLVRFTPAEGGDIIYFRLDTDYGDYEFDRTISAEDIAQHSGYDFGRYDFKELFVLNITFDGFIMIFENGGAEVWTQYGVTTQGNIVYVLYIELISTVTKSGNVYTFEETRTSTGQSYENSFKFSVDAKAGTATIILPEQHEVVTVASGLTLDYTERKATYNGQVVDYWYTIGYVDFYTFEIGPGRELNYWVTSGQHSGFHPVSDDDIYDVFTIAGVDEGDYIPRLIFLDDEAEGGKKVYLAFMLESGMFRVIGEGSMADLGEEYRFTLGSHLSDLGQSELNGFTQFDFKLYEDGSFRIKSDSLEFSNLRSDGYGSYTFTDAAGASHTGMIAEVFGEGESRLIYFAESGAMEATILTVDSANNRVVEATEDVGYWYEMNDNQLISLYRYFILNGRGDVYKYEINDLTGELTITKGTYARTARYAGADASEPFPEYTITLNGETANYLLAYYYVSDTTTGLPIRLPLYQAQIAHRVGNFNVRGGGRIESIGYPGELATYTDARGTVYEGNMYIGTVGEGIRDHSFENGASGQQVCFRVYVSGLATSTEFFFDIENGVLVPYTLPYGAYAFSSRDGVVENRVLTLDGRGNATYRFGSTNPTAGTYAAVPGEDGQYRFTAANRNFTFRLNSVYADDETIYVYEQLAEEGAFDLFYADEWSVLSLNGYGEAVCINRYGDRILGSYVLFGTGLGAFESENFNAIFSYAAGEFSFIDHSSYVASYYAEDFSAVILTETRMIFGDKEYFYNVTEKTVNLYAVEGAHAQSTAPLPEGDTYNYNETAYYRYTGGELVFTDSEYNAEEPIELRFTPSGASFTATATFGGESGYTVVVSYQGGKVNTSLTYHRGADTLSEQYPLALRFGAGEKTFTVTPTGGTVTYSQDIAPATQNTLTLDTRRVGAYSVALHDADAGDTLVVNFADVQDSAGNALAYSGSIAEMTTETDASFSYDYLRLVKATAKDGIVYSIRFFINEAEQKFLLHSILIEKTLGIEEVGEVTFAQFWAAGTGYSGYKQKELVSVSMHETGVETNIYSGVLAENRAALVRQSLNTTAGSYDFEAYVFDVTYGENGLVTSAVEEKGYSYGEAEQGIAYKVRFLFKSDGTSFEVAYILTLSENDRYVNVTEVTPNDDGSFTATAAGATYRITVTRSGAGFALTVTKQQTP